MSRRSLLSAVREASERQRKREQREEATRDALVMASPPPPLLRPNQSSLPSCSGREVEHPGPLKKKDRKSFYGDKWETKLFKKGVPGTLYAFFRSCWEQHRGGTAGEASSVFADPFKTFSRQRHMFEWADDLGRGREGGERLRYFAFEVSTASGSSRRGFLATTLRRFWRHYSVMPSCSRHYYELIRENEPCSMYYDLEFSKALNEGRAESGDRIVDLVISLTRDELRERFGVDLIAGAVELDSSTDKKWSRHLILHLGGGSTLASNAHAGQIASSVCSRLLEKVGEGCPRHRELMVVGSGGVEAPLIDVSVYSRNRTFRIWRSSKCGKGVELLPTPRFLGGTFLKDAALRKSGVERRFFEDSLVTGRAAGGEGARLSCEEVDAGTRGGLVGLSGNKVHQRTPRCAPCRPEEGEGPLLRYPKLCRFLCDSESPDGRPLGRLRSHVHFVESGTIIINLAENRYCSRVGRQHKSNGVFLVVDCKLGQWYQKCYDPDCRGHRGESRPLPLDVMVELSEEDPTVEVEDDEFLRQVDAIEEEHLGEGKALRAES